MGDGDSRIEELTARLALLERRMADEAASIRVELAELRGEQPAPQPAPAARPSLETAQPDEWHRLPAARAPFPRPQAAAAPPPSEPVDLSWLAGPRGLALAGAVVTLLGIGFVFVLAASRGWIGPAVRCSIGGGVSLLLLGAALVARDRYGQMSAALAAAGTGIGGLYVTLYAASRGYHLLGTGSVWAAVVVVAVLAVALALAWSSELLAVLGLTAAVVAPPVVEGKLTGIGLGASVVAAAAALGIGQRRRWLVLGGLAYGLTLAQVAVYIVDARHGFFDEGAGQVEWRHRGTAGALACLVFALALAGAAAHRRRAGRLDAFSAALVASSLPLALLSTWVLVHSDTGRGGAFLVLAAAYAMPAVALRLLDGTDGLAELLLAFALFAVALATATYLSLGGLLAAWTLEGLVLTALAVWRGQPRHQAAGLAYLAAAAVHLFIFETPLTHLFSERPNPAQHIAELLLMIGALAVTAFLLQDRELLVPHLDVAAAGAAALLLLYAASLGVMEAAQRLGGAELHAKFQRGETLVSALWALVALALLAAGLVQRSKDLRYGGLSLLALALAKLFLFDLSQLSSLARAASFLAVGVALLLGGFLVQRLARNGTPPLPHA